MEIFIITLVFFSICFLGMAIGVIFHEKRTLKGSCGGVGSNGSCSTCGGNKLRCKNKEKKEFSKGHYSDFHKLIQNKQNKY